MRQLPTAVFGRTGHPSTRTIFGAAALGSVDQVDADRTVELLLEYGVNHIDTAASYGDSELRLGPSMQRHRDRFFLASKTGQRSYAGARSELHRSLERLRVHRLDLIQLHCLIDPADWETAMGPDGALRALTEARSEGLVRYIGVTGHGVTAPRMHLRSLERFDFDAVLLPYNPSMMDNASYAEAFTELAALCSTRNVAVQTIKAISARPYADGEPHTHAAWYAPLTEPRDIETAVHWVLSNPQVFLNTAGDITLLPKILDAATTFSADEPRLALDARAAALGTQPLFV